MAFRGNMFTGQGGINTPGGAGAVGSTRYQQVSPTSDPTFARLLEQIQAITPTALPGIEQITAQGMNSPLLQLVLGPALQRLQAPQAQARQNLTEQTRAAGGLRGSTYGQDMNKLVANQGLQQNDLMAQVIQQVLGTLISGQLQSQQNQMLPGKSLTELLRTIAPQTITGSTGGGGAGGGGGVLSSPRLSDNSSVSPADFDARLRGFPDAASMRFQQMLDASRSSGPGTLPGGISGGGLAGGGSSGGKSAPYLDPLGGPSTPFGPEAIEPMPLWNPTTGAYQGGTGGGTFDNTEQPWWVE